MSCISLSAKIAVILLRVTDIGNNDSASFALLCLTLLSGILQLETIKLSFSQPALGPGCEEVEKEALLQFKQNLTDLSRRLLSWVGDDCCSWRGRQPNKQPNLATALCPAQREPLIPELKDSDDKGLQQEKEQKYSYG
ncbi:hypothetical protein WN944_010367 [Citrus x changshan-huyou]|uniref:Leucine-rich repeat-containing N-terminal plant-type domain-containing protein n=1 Tax=Citrus x changshan-huyou TaxID=2935761 RepID=A0AAP0QXS3_9ROSI